MRALMCLLLLGCLVSGANAQPAKIDRIDILGVGLCKEKGEAKIIEDKNISVGQRTEQTVVLTERTNIIQLKLGMIICADLKFISRHSGQATVRVVWRYPQPGIKNPATGIAKYSDEFDTPAALNVSGPYYWNLEKEYTLVPGIWTLEIWEGGRQLMRQDFTLVK